MYLAEKVKPGSRTIARFRKDNPEFEKTFSFDVNLGLFNASWSVTKKK